MAYLLFPSPTQLRNISDPSSASDAATKSYVDTAVSGATAAAAGSNTQVQFNNNGSFYASSNFTFNNSTNLLTITGNISVTNTANIGNINITGTANLGNVSNVKITGGSSGYVLKTDGAGNLSWGSTSGSLTGTVDEFTGTGSQTDFTLSVTPGNKNLTFVVVQGLMQPKSSYSVTGTTLSFSEAPPSGYFIEVTTMGLA